MNNSATLRNIGGFGSTEKSAKVKPKSETKTKAASNQRYNKLLQNQQKVTFQLPWNDHYYMKGLIQLHQKGFCLTSIDDPPSDPHVRPSSTILKMTQSDKLLLGHYHSIQKQSIHKQNIKSSLPLRVIDEPLSAANNKGFWQSNNFKKDSVSKM